ncbi:DUF5667 domain-containing protein [Streptomyces cacaoi]|uniref:DUF5667 domain-containing protein n=1 Tax=Streptomyces cacaoi TaxID=1898 RepID=UPI000A36C7BE|nr:DUF5667 domain-containing protein [Streptomyces cacaoi]
MIGSIPTSRRALAFAQALDEQRLDEGTAADTTSPAPSEGDDGAPPGDPAGQGERALLALTGQLAALPKPELDPEVKTVQRAQLIAAMEAAFADGENAAEGAHFPEQRDARSAAHGSGRGAHRAPGLASLSRLRPKSRLGKGLAAGGLAVEGVAGAFGGAAAASTDALPGDTLYGLKRGMEDIQLDLAGDDADRGNVLLDHASTRLKEAGRLMERQRSGALDHEALGEVRRTLAGMRHDASEGHRLLSAAYERDGDIHRLQRLSTFSENHRAGWAKLRDRLPAQLRDVGDEVSSVFDAMDNDVSPLHALLPRTSEESDAPHERHSDSADRTGEDEPSAQPSRSSSAGADGRSEDASRAPDPSGTQQGGEGLLGGDLLEPPDRSEAAERPSESGGGSDHGRSGPGKPEVTLPPLVPEVLPDLGLGGSGKE